MKFWNEKIKFFLLAITIAVFLGLANAFGINAKTAEELQAEINQYLAQLATLATQANTLSNQIKQFDAQINLTTLKISQTEEKIRLLGGRIDQLEGSLTDLTEAFSSRAVETYKMSRFENNFLFMLGAADIDDAVARFHYLQRVQKADTDLMERLQRAQTIYIDEKSDQEVLQEQLETQKSQLNSQKAAKAKLLAETRNSEKTYQRLLAQAQAEYEAIQNVIAGKGTETEAGHVGQGDRIAGIIQGSSCNSGGTHLHFTVSQNGSAQNPFNFLKSGIDYENCSGSSCGSSDGDPFNPSGSWDWPISAKIKFNQGYGSTWAVRNTYYGKIYNFHNGIDINSGSSDVRAVRSGTLYKGSYVGSGGCTLRYVRVHNDDGGLDTFYLHVNY